MNAAFNILDLLIVSPALVLFLASIMPLTIKVLRGNREQNPVATLVWAFIGLVAAAGLAISTSGIEQMAFGGALIFDGVSTWSTLIIILITGFSLLMAKENPATCNHQFSEFVFLLLNAAAGMILLAWSNDLIVTFISVEIMSLCLYILIALSQEERLSKEAAFKYFILGSFGSAIFLYGIAFIFGVGGTTYLNEITNFGADLISTNRLFLIGIVLTIVGFCFKVGLAPFHAWSPDVYEGSPTPLTGFMAAGVKVVVFAALLRLFSTQILTGVRAFDVAVILQWIAVASMLLGNIAALLQTSLKRMLAYSSISHSGYAVIGVIAAGLGGEDLLGASGTVFYIFAYTIVTLGTFGFVCLFEKRENTMLMIDDLRGLASRSPWLALSMTVLLLSLAGIPPTVGFFAKFFIFSAAIKQGLIWLAIWGVINSVISVYYYLRPIVYMYMFDGPASDVLEDRQMTQFSVAIMAGIVVIVGVMADPFYQFVVRSVASL